MKPISQRIYGVLLCTAIAIAAKFLSGYVALGSVSIALLLGILVGNVAKIGERFKPGISFSEKVLLSISIALMGVNLDYLILQELGYRTMFLIVLAIAGSILSSIYLAKWMNVKHSQALLIGIGNGICGSSAIAATTQIIRAEEEEVGIAVAIVNLLGTIGMLLLPVVGTLLLKFSDIQAGILIGSTLQSIGQAAAGGYAISDTAGQTAIIVKMGRILMITPFLFILVLSLSNEQATPQLGRTRRILKKIPLFIFGFVLFSVISTFHWLPDNYLGGLGVIGNVLLLVAMSGIALKIKILKILKNARFALLLGITTFLSQILFSSYFVYFLL